MVSPGDSFKAFCHKRQRSGSVGKGGHGCRKVFKIEDGIACLYNDRNDIIKRRKWPCSREKKKL